VAFIGWTTDETEQAKLLDTLELYKTGGVRNWALRFLKVRRRHLPEAKICLERMGTPDRRGAEAITDRVFSGDEENEASF
jgi:hypothetical protein